MNQRDIGIFLGMGTGAAVCRQLQRLRERQRRDGTLKARIERIGADLQPSPERTSTVPISNIKG